ncbi:MinD/ParA family protein [Kiloniella laminariae]|uniref:MinD/ParA family protein n=1 Tax=Kiloniella laminariae TaxID=454162 RepID=A0ABT4LJM0_9PROT|nr:MinD/ParA family protein [Kiloniella laminariae]MCZ4280531.1 MinD/ParA family protein [Kiloniella laminariae]
MNEAKNFNVQSLHDKVPCQNMIAIASGKGGVGKTWLSITLSHALSNLGCRTLLFDGDLGLANVDIQLGLAPNKDMGGVLTGRYALKDAAVRYPEGGFDVLAGRSGSGSLANLPAQRLSHLTSDLANLSGSYDRVILDLGAGIDRTVRQLAAQAQVCLVITTDEPTSLTDAYAFIKLTKMQRPDADLRVIVNMAETEHDGHKTYNTIRKACESFLKITPPLAGIIVKDSKIKEAIRNQTPLLVRYPTSPAAERVEQIARNLLSDR